MREMMSKNPSTRLPGGWRTCVGLLLLSALWGCEEEGQGAEEEGQGAEEEAADQDEVAGSEPDAPSQSPSDERVEANGEPDEAEESEEQALSDVTGPKGWSLSVDESWYEQHVGPRDLDESSLSVHEGSLDIGEAGAVLEDMRIEGQLNIHADDVTVRNTVVEGALDLRESRGALIEDVIVRSDSYYPVDAADAEDWTLQYAEVDGLESPDNNGGLNGGGGRVRYSEFHSHTDSAKVGSNSVWEYNWLHTNSTWGTDAHVDGLQSTGASNVMVRRNYIDMPVSNQANSAIIAQSNFGAIRNWTVKENYLNGGNFTVYFRSKGHGEPEDIVIEDNRIGRDYRYGLLSSDGDGVELAQNYWADTGELID